MALRMIAEIDRLRRASALCQSAEDNDVRWLGSVIEDVLQQRAAGEEASLDCELGLIPCALRSYRDTQIRAARACLSTTTVSAAAKELSRLARRLQSAGAAFRDSSPGPEEARRLIARALSTGLRFPSKRQIINILGVQ